MSVRTRMLWLLPPVLALVSAAPSTDPAELVRQGNAALDRADYAAAVDFYARAEERITDPGLVSFNKGTALYRLGRFREAELHFRRCREDATGPRLARVHYDLANCLLREAQGKDTAALAEAIRLYSQCLTAAEADPTLAADARHNLEVAKLLWLEARANKDKPDERDPNDGADNSKPPPKGNDPRPGMEEPGAGTPDPNEKAGPPSAVADQQPTPTEQPRPGPGNLPPVPDKDELIPLSHEDAAAHLQRATEQILRERREYRQRSVKVPAKEVKDW